MSETDVIGSGWLAPDQLEDARAALPMVYIDAVPVRVDHTGTITHVGLLLRHRPDGTISRAVVSGRVLYRERVRDAVLRHIEKDLGPMAMPQLPTSPSPFTVAEYFPDPSVTGFHDPRQHAVSLAFVVPLAGEVQVSGSALDLAWVTPEEATSPDVVVEMTGGQDRLVRLALAASGRLP